MTECGRKLGKEGYADLGRRLKYRSINQGLVFVKYPLTDLPP